MKRRSRTRRVLKWVGLVGCVLIVIAWVLSTRWACGYAGVNVCVFVGEGTIGYGINESPLMGWMIEDLGGPPWRSICWWPEIYGGSILRGLRVPLWMPLVTVAIPTAILWWRHRERLSEQLKKWRDIKRRRSKSSRIVMRCGRVTCILLLITWIATMNISVGYSSYASGRFRSAGLGWGSIVITRLQNAQPPPADWTPGWSASSSYRFWHTKWFPQTTVGTLYVPLWIPLLIVVIPTVYLWLSLWSRERLFPAECCQMCGYDLTGNTTGICPECGEPTAERPESGPS